MNQTGYMPREIDDYADPYYPNYSLAYTKDGKVQFPKEGQEHEAYDADDGFYKIFVPGRDDVEMALMLDDGSYEELESDWYDDNEDDEDIPEFDQSALQKKFNNTIRKHLGMGGFDNEKQLKLFQSFKEYFNEESDKSVVAKDSGYTFKTGKEITIPFIRNTEKALHFGKRFQQDIEPHGTYMLLNSNPDEEPISGWIKGTVTFQKPLVIPLNLEPNGPIYNESSWKYLLVKKYKKIGKALTQALKNDGYDAIVTVDMKDGSTSEIVKL
jgi:hypothetical protein